MHTESEQIYEDVMSFDRDDKGYSDFISFIEDFFKIKSSNYEDNDDKIKKWLTSVESSNNKA